MGLSPTSSCHLFSSLFPDVLFVNTMERNILRQLRGTSWTMLWTAVSVIKSALDKSYSFFKMELSNMAD